MNKETQNVLNREREHYTNIYNVSAEQKTKETEGGRSLTKQRTAVHNQKP